MRRLCLGRTAVGALGNDPRPPRDWPLCLGGPRPKQFPPESCHLNRHQGVIHTPANPLMLPELDCIEGRAVSRQFVYETQEPKTKTPS